MRGDSCSPPLESRYEESERRGGRHQFDSTWAEGGIDRLHCHLFFQRCIAKLKYHHQHHYHHNIRIVTQNSPLLFEKLVVVDDDAAIITMSELIIYTSSSAHARPE